MEQKMIIFLAVAVAVGLAAGAGIGYLVFNEEDDPEGDYITFYLYDNGEYEPLYKSCTVAAWNPIEITTFYQLNGSTYEACDSNFNPFDGNDLNTNLYGLIPGTTDEYQQIVALYYYYSDSYVEYDAVAWANKGSENVYYEGLSAYVPKDVVKGIWVKGYGSTTLECFNDAVKRAGYTADASGGWISSFNGVDDGNFCTLAWYGGEWVSYIDGNNFSLNINGVTEYVAVGHGAWHSAMWTPPLPDQEPDDIKFVI